MDNKYLVINYIWIEKDTITIGATDSERWGWEMEDSSSGGEAFSFVQVTLDSTDKHYFTSQIANFFCHPTDPIRTLAMAHVSELFDIAWDIKNKKLSMTEVKKVYFGNSIK